MGAGILSLPMPSIFHTLKSYSPTLLLPSLTLSLTPPTPASSPLTSLSTMTMATSPMTSVPTSLPLLLPPLLHPPPHELGLGALRISYSRRRERRVGLVREHAVFVPVVHCIWDEDERFAGRGGAVRGAVVCFCGDWVSEIGCCCALEDEEGEGKCRWYVVGGGKGLGYSGADRL